MLDPLERHSRDSTLFQHHHYQAPDGTSLIPTHLLIQIDEQFDFQKLVEPLVDYYCATSADPPPPRSARKGAADLVAVQCQLIPTTVRGNIGESGISLVLLPDEDDEVFNHSTISYFIERVGNEGFGQLFQRFNGSC